MDSGLPRNTFTERRIDDSYYLFIVLPKCLWIIGGLFIQVSWILLTQKVQKLTLKNLKNKVTFNYYRLLNKIKKDSNESKNNTH